MSDDAPPTSGWDAIDRALATLHGEQEPLHWGTIVKWSLGGEDPLDGLSAYRVDTGTPHWHLVSYGLSELYDKESEDPSTSGFGLELTFRLARTPGDEQPPIWALNFMQNLARYIVQTGRVLLPGHHINANGPIAVGDPTALTAALFVRDPGLPPLTTPHGGVEFVQIVGITADELEAINAWDSHRFAEVLARRAPLLVTDLARRSLLDDPAAAAEIGAGIERDGSSMDSVFVDTARVEKDGGVTALVLGAVVAGRVAGAMRGRLLHERPLTVRSRELEVLFEPAPVAGWRHEGDAMVIETSPELAQAIADALGDRRAGRYPFDGLARFEIRVVPTEIKDADGAVVETIG